MGSVQSALLCHNVILMTPFLCYRKITRTIQENNVEQQNMEQNNYETNRLIIKAM